MQAQIDIRNAGRVHIRRMAALSAAASGGVGSKARATLARGLSHSGSGLALGGSASTASRNSSNGGVIVEDATGDTRTPVATTTGNIRLAMPLPPPRKPTPPVLATAAAPLRLEHEDVTLPPPSPATASMAHIDTVATSNDAAAPGVTAPDLHHHSGTAGVDHESLRTTTTVAAVAVPASAAGVQVASGGVDDACGTLPSHSATVSTPIASVSSSSGGATLRSVGPGSALPSPIERDTTQDIIHDTVDREGEPLIRQPHWDTAKATGSTLRAGIRNDAASGDTDTVDGATIAVSIGGLPSVVDETSKAALALPLSASIQTGATAEGESAQNHSALDAPSVSAATDTATLATSAPDSPPITAAAATKPPWVCAYEGKERTMMRSRM